MIPSPPLGTDAAAGLLAPGALTGADPDGAAAERRFHFELAAHPGSPAQARRLTRTRLTAWSVCEDTCDTADLVISELVTNAIVHTASSRVVCELHDRGELVRIAVRDEGRAPGEPHPSPQRPEEEHGRGLLLVEAMCLSWGAQQHGQGLVVWAELARGTHDDTHDTHDSRNIHDVHDLRGDLGWGARPKPDPTPDPHPTPPPPTPLPSPSPPPSPPSSSTSHPGPSAHDESAYREAQGHRAYAHDTHGSGAVWL
ncbi:ATP-binding protein [Streptomyces spiralis]|uniref:ATP-binding protein n=1 Tax=Streptomyces spiralis TaxID=66376 RepID=UPI0036971E2A